MLPKQRILNTLSGKEVDRFPWSPFLAYFWEHLPTQTTEKGMQVFYEDIGADPMLRGSHALFNIAYKNCNITEKISGNEKFTSYETPIGTIVEKSVYTAVGNTWFLMDHPIKCVEDFKILSYINENMIISSNYSTFINDYNAMGDNGLIIPIIGTQWKTCFQSLVEHWVGTEELVYALADYPEVVQETLEVMQNKAIKTVEYSIDSPAEAFIFWEDSSTTNISPSMFEKYTAPEINAWGKIIHREGKYLIHHACGHLRHLLDAMSKTEIDVIESISPPPTGNIDLWEAKELIPQNIGLIGGIEPTVFLNSTMDELEAYVYELINNMKGSRFVLANSDSCPPGVSIEKFRLVTDIVRGQKY